MEKTYITPEKTNIYAALEFCNDLKAQLAAVQVILRSGRRIGPFQAKSAPMAPPGASALMRNGLRLRLNGPTASPFSAPAT
jgi:hypothetical protein